ncbi:Uncharacterised protein [Mycobacterium tuberculosis]|nr:Uncharacterised protein [Mycobacterium tuberculosis]CNM87459.1 Uncharacterised protein [Mycobacterium tuberculosis]CNN01748.1 Uncharacterised protein [Mycobacterium tuberculosis]CNW04865.1 Uncharacterised protein [Mycobacterium tuberculosis]COW22623.1 Uncharacterised protein [Mycobacterium tuberculosis]
MPSARSTRIDATRPAVTRSASPMAAAWLASGSSVNVSNDRPPRSRNQANSPSTRTTSAPALRPGRAVPSALDAGQGNAAPYGLAGSAAASTTAW